MQKLNAAYVNLHVIDDGAVVAIKAATPMRLQLTASKRTEKYDP